MDGEHGPGARGPERIKLAGVRAVSRSSRGAGGVDGGGGIGTSHKLKGGEGGKGGNLGYGGGGLERPSIGLAHLVAQFPSVDNSVTI